ncbi:MAG: SOS response-associated peptidase [Gammaproteobacteria bacterium]|jgi:putative SOS response-associated peptidase YedK|nr:SOS response-associated peptidase [Gammaproteobacteria bacterium]
MCGRFAFFSPAEAIREAFGQAAPDALKPRYNIAPTQSVQALVANSSGTPEWRQFRWGLVPFWAKDRSIGNRLINARAETLGAKPAFRGAFRRQRCLVAASGFYEWHSEGGHKTPWYISRADERPFVMAGIWDTWQDDGTPLHTCSIITAPANEFMRSLHHRMPVLLDTVVWPTWFAADARRDALESLLLATQQVELQAWAVSRRVNSPANDAPDLVTAVGYPAGGV